MEKKSSIPHSSWESSWCSGLFFFLLHSLCHPLWEGSCQCKPAGLIEKQWFHLFCCAVAACLFCHIPARLESTVWCLLLIWFVFSSICCLVLVWWAVHPCAIFVWMLLGKLQAEITLLIHAMTQRSKYARFMCSINSARESLSRWTVMFLSYAAWQCCLNLLHDNMQRLRKHHGISIT